MKRVKLSAYAIFLLILASCLCLAGVILLIFALNFSQLDFNSEGLYLDPELLVVLKEQSVFSYFLLSGLFLIPGFILGFIVVRKIFYSGNYIQLIKT